MTTSTEMTEVIISLNRIEYLLENNIAKKLELLTSILKNSEMQQDTSNIEMGTTLRMILKAAERTNSLLEER